MHVHGKLSSSSSISVARPLERGSRTLARPRPVFFVRVPSDRALPASEALDEYLQRWLLRELSGWAQLVILELLADGSVEWIDDAVPTLAEPGGHRLIAVRCVDRLGPRRPGLWAALTIASAIAERLDGVVVDARRGLVALGEGQRLRPPADARVRASDHLCVPSSRSPSRRRWLSSVGMSHFGLPDLELVEVPDNSVEIAARLLLGVAQHLIDSAWTPPRANGHPREIMLTIGELHWALGGEAGSVPTTCGRGWTRVAVELDAGRSWPELLRIGPPNGVRSWRDAGNWLRDAWVDLFGPAPVDTVRLRATA